jgi:hypothetical protein
MQRKGWKRQTYISALVSTRASNHVLYIYIHIDASPLACGRGPPPSRAAKGRGGGLKGRKGRRRIAKTTAGTTSTHAKKDIGMQAHKHAHTSTNTRRQARKHTQTHRHTDTYIHKHTHTHTRTPYTQHTHTRTHTHTHTHIYTHTRAHARTHARTRARTHTHTHQHTHTHIHTYIHTHTRARTHPFVSRVVGVRKRAVPNIHAAVDCGWTG